MIDLLIEFKESGIIIVTACGKAVRNYLAARAAVTEFLAARVLRQGKGQISLRPKLISPCGKASAACGKELSAVSGER